MNCPQRARRRRARSHHAGRFVLAVPIVIAFIVIAGCSAKKSAKRDKDRSFLTADALYERAMEELADENLRKAEEFLERIQLIDPATVRRLEPLVRLGMADVTFYYEDDLSLIEARSKYLDFVTLYSDHPRAPYAQLQAGMCSLLQVRHHTRDQTLTFEAIADLRGVMRRYPSSPYADAALDMIARAETTLASHDFAVGRFYYNKKAWDAATHRFKRILDRYPRYRDREELYFYLGRALFRAENALEGRIYLERVISDYPGGKLAKEAQKFLDKAAAAAAATADGDSAPGGEQNPAGATDTAEGPRL